MSDAQQQREYSGPEKLREHAWKPGQSGNPGGRPKGSGVTDRLRKILAEGDNGKDVAGALVKAALKAAEKGDFRFWKEIVDRVDGPVKQRIEAEIHQIRVVYEDRKAVTDD